MEKDLGISGKQEKIAEEFLRLLKFSRCSVITLKAAAANLEITEGELDLIFPSSINEVIKFLFEKHKLELSNTIFLKEDGVTAGIKAAIMHSYHLLLPYKTEVRKIIKFITLSSNIVLIPSFTFSIADVIWKSLGINDSGFSFYTKRLILASIYSNTFIFFLLNKDVQKLEKLVDLELKGFVNVIKIVKSRLTFLKTKWGE